VEGEVSERATDRDKREMAERGERGERGKGETMAWEEKGMAIFRKVPANPGQEKEGEGKGEGESCPNNCSEVGTCDRLGRCHCPFEYLWSIDCSQTRKEMIDWDQFMHYVYAVLAIYALLLIYTLLVLCYLNCGSVLSLSIQNICYLAMALAFACTFLPSFPLPFPDSNNRFFLQARIAYYSIDPGAFNDILPPWLDRLVKFIMFLFLFTAFSAILYSW